MSDSKSDKTKTGAAKKPPAKPAPMPAAKGSSAKPTAKPAAKKQPAKTTAAKPAATKPAAAKTPAKKTPTRPATPKPAAAAVQEENPLHKKLRLQATDTGLVVAPPEGDDDPLAPLPKSFKVLKSLDKLATTEGQFDYIHVFAWDRAELAQAFGLLRGHLSPGGSLWISWMKMSSKHRGGDRGQATDLNDTVIRRLGLMNGMVDVKVATLDRNWSALLLVHRKR